MVQEGGGAVLKDPIYDEAAKHILESILKRQRYGFEVADKIAAHIERTVREVEQNRIKREAKLLLHRTKE